MRRNRGGRYLHQSRGGAPGQRDDRSRPATSTVAALVLASLALMALDSLQAGSPVEPVRTAIGAVYGPVEAGAAAAVRPVVGAPDWLRSHHALQDDIARLQSQNARLRSTVRTTSYARNRLAEYDELTTAATDSGYALVPARVVAMGPAQSFARAVTVDAGTRAGVRPDMTVVNGDGLVGRVLRASSNSATVLLVADADSVVGARVGGSLEVGFLHGRGQVDRTGRLDLELADQTVVPTRDDTVVTWGSGRDAPYVSGIPVGRITSVYSSIRETTQRAVVDPYVDFGALDLVGVVVPSGTRSDRAVIEADGSLR